MKNIFFVFLASAIMSSTYGQTKKSSKVTDRQLWLSYLDKVARPVFMNLATDQLKEKMPVVLSKNVDNKDNRIKASYLEAFGRTLSGISAWLNIEGGSSEETVLRKQYRQWAVKAVGNAVNPSAKDYMKWTGGQPLVDASFFAFGLIRCPWLWNELDSNVKQQVVTALRLTRSTVPVYSNWILFSAMIEAFFCKYGFDYDALRIEYGVREFSMHWYVGDGMFSDGMEFHLDYYNSYVIQPYLSAIVEIINKKNNGYASFLAKLDMITKRYAEIQERMINTDGSFPLTGRSITYRGGAFHHLSDMSLRKQLPISLTPAQVRSALTAVLKKTMEAPATFTKDGWLNIGLYGHQPNLAEFYINTGSLYLCAEIFLPLGLPDTDEFWSSPAVPWTAIKAWSGQDVSADHAIDLK
jgi:hypothetical protein